MKYKVFFKMSVKYKDESHKSENGIDSTNKSESISENVQRNPVYFPGTDIYDNNAIDAYNSRNYPHWELHSVVYHACYRLADSVPMEMQRHWIEERKQIQGTCKKEQRPLTEDEMKRLQYLYTDRIERYLDVGYGSCVLQKPQAAAIVRGSLEYYNRIKYLLHAWCIMPNHVHVVFQALADHSHTEIIHGWKSFTAHAINKQLGMQGALWQSDCYNHIIRTEKEYYQQIRYVWNNPLKAGHVKWEWKWKCLED